MATKTDPYTLKLQDQFKAAIDATPGLERVPFTPDVPLDGEVRPNTEAAFTENADRLVRPEKPASRHVSAGVLVYYLDSPALRIKLAELVEKFREGMKKTGMEMRGAPPLPHVPDYFVGFYHPVIIDGGYARVIASYSLQEQAYRISLDAYAAKSEPEPTPTPDPRAGLPAYPPKLGTTWGDIRKAFGISHADLR